MKQKQNEVIVIKENIDGKEVVVRTEYPGELYQKSNGFCYDYDNKAWIYHSPQEFVAPSEHDKYIIFQYCRCSVDDSIHGECEVHASFIPRDQYCDSLVYYANLQPPDDIHHISNISGTNKRMKFNFRGDHYRILTDGGTNTTASLTIDSITYEETDEIVLKNDLNEYVLKSEIEELKSIISNLQTKIAALEGA